MRPRFVGLSRNRTGALSPRNKKRSTPAVRHKGLLGYSRVGLFGSGTAARRHYPVDERSGIRRPRSPPPSVAHALERPNVKPAVHEERQVDLPGHRGRAALALLEALDTHRATTMSGDRLEVNVTFDERGYIGSAPELRSPVMALSLGGLRRCIEALLLPDDIVLPLTGRCRRG
jgi:hypothetical protein